MLLIAAAIVALIVLGVRTSKKSVRRRLSVLLNASKLAVWDILQTHFLSSPSDMPQANLVASAAVNFLFGEAVDSLHHDLDLSKIHAEATKLLGRSNLLKELVTQSLRISTTLDFMKGKTISDRKLEILSMFGSEYPTAPNPDSYERLVRRVIRTLSPEMQKSILLDYGIAGNE